MPNKTKKSKVKREGSAKKAAAARPGLKLRSVEVQGYRAFDEITLDFPAPVMAGDPDIVVIGSKNGVGKTSILEACALCLLAATSNRENVEIPYGYSKKEGFQPLELMIRGGCTTANVQGSLSYDGEAFRVTTKLDREGSVWVANGHASILRGEKRSGRPGFMHVKELPELFPALLGLEPDPVLMPRGLYFHSYRKVLEGNPEFGDLVNGTDMFRHRSHRNHWRRGEAVSVLKMEVLRAIMGKAEVFEDFESGESDAALETANNLVRKFAGGVLEKLRPSGENTIDFRVSPADGSPSYSFDGLSSGQKEIISTLFLIWKYTHNRPGVVLIDEPELHLNAEWHRAFVRTVTELAPDNQYIIATHSADVFASVEADRRLLLSEGGTGF